MLSIRKASQDDIDIYFNWANDLIVRKNAFSKDKITWENHVEWYAGKLKDENCYLYVLEKDHQPIGQVRFDIDSAKGEAEIGYSVDANYRGKGVGTKMMGMGITQLQRDTDKVFSFIAKVKEANVASANIFINIGFEKINDFYDGACKVDIFKIIV